MDKARLRAKWVGRYTLLSEVGRGGVGVVHRARGSDGKLVALKLLLAGKDAGPLQRRRMATEVSTLLRLRHPNLVALLDAGEHEGVPYLVMEWIEGETLAARVARDGPLELSLAVGLVRRLAEGLAHCHEQGVLHRDLKPENVLVRAKDGQPLLTDFGLAKDEVAENDSNPTIMRTEVGRWLGTPGYWPPEQAHGELEAIGPRSDVYGLGALLFFCLTGHAPQEGETIQAICEALQRGPIPPSRHRQDLPAWVDALCLRALATDPAARPPNAEAFARELRRSFRPTPAPIARTSRRAIGTGALVAALSACSVGALCAALVVSSARPPDQATVALSPSAPPPPPTQPQSVPAPGSGPSPGSDLVRLAEWRAPSPPWQLALRAGSTRFAVSCEDGAIHFADLGLPGEWLDALGHSPPSAPTPRRQPNNVKALAVSSDGRLLASGARDRWVRVWSLPERALVAEHAASAEIWSLAFSPGGERLAVATQREAPEVFLLGPDLRGGNRRTLLAGAVARPHPGMLDWSSDGKRLLVTISAVGHDDSRLTLIDVDGDVRDSLTASEAVEAGLLTPPPPGRRGRCFSGARFAADDRLAVIASWDEPRVVVWDIGARRWDGYLEYSGSGCSQLIVRGDLVVVGTHDGALIGWSLESRRRLFRVEQGTVVNGLAVVPDEPLRLLSASSDGRVVAWEMR